MKFKAQETTLVPITVLWGAGLIVAGLLSSHWMPDGPS